MKVPALSIAFIILNIIAPIALALGAAIYLKRKYSASWKAFGIGCLGFLLSAMLVEGAFHAVFMRLPVWKIFENSIVLKIVYGATAAALFEETGRLLAMKYALRKRHGNDANALMYGVGHGGIEAILVLSGTMCVNLILALKINASPADLQTAAVDPSVVNVLTMTPPYEYLMGLIERLSAMVGHAAMSVFVWFSVARPKAKHYYLIALLMHFILDASAVFFLTIGWSTVLIEIAVALIVAVMALAAKYVWKKEMQKKKDTEFASHIHGSC